MKDNLITAVFTMVGFLMAQNFPVLTGFLVYLAFAFLMDRYITKVAMEYELEFDDNYGFRFIFALLWPIFAIILFISEYDRFKEVYNLPSIRNPFYWPEK